MKRGKLISVIITVALLSACGDTNKGKILADTAINNFHRQFNESKFKELYTAASPDLKSVTNEADFIKLLEAVQRKLGKQTRSSEGGSNINFSTKTVVTIAQNTEFEHGKGIEKFTYVISDGNCTLKGYNIDSKELIIK